MVQKDDGSFAMENFQRFLDTFGCIGDDHMDGQFLCKFKQTVKNFFCPVTRKIFQPYSAAKLKDIFCMCSGGNAYSFTFVSPSLRIFNAIAVVAFLPQLHSTVAWLRMAVVSPTANPLKVRSDAANNITEK